MSDGGPGEWLRLEFPRAVVVGRIGLVIGYDKVLQDRVGDRWPLNNRVKRARIEWEGGQTERDFADDRSVQWVNVGGRRTSWLRVVVLAVRPGERWNDTLIAEVICEGWPEVESSPGDHVTGGAPPAAGVLPELPTCPAAGSADVAQAAIDEGKRLQEEDRTEEAIQAYRRAIDADRSRDSAYSLLAYLYLKTGRPGDALPHVLQALGCLERSSKNWMRLGDTYVQLGQDALALAAYDRALDVAPGDAATILRKGGFQWMLGDQDGARATWRPACDGGSRAACNRIERGIETAPGVDWRVGWGTGSAGAASATNR